MFDILSVSVSLPDVYGMIFHRTDKSYDALRWSVFKWVLDLDDEFLMKIKCIGTFKNLTIVLITLQYLTQVMYNLVLTI